MPGAVVYVENKPPGHPPDAMWPPCPRQGHAVGPVSDVYEGGGGSLFLFPCRAVSFRSSSFSGRPRRISGCAPGRARHMVRPIICLPDLLCAVLAFCDEVPYLCIVIAAWGGGALCSPPGGGRTRRLVACPKYLCFYIARSFTP